MGMHFSEKKGRENFLRSIGGEKNLKRFENHFKKWTFSKEEESVLKRFFVREPKGLTFLLDYLDENPNLKLVIRSFELFPDKEISGLKIYSSSNSNYKLFEGFKKEIILIEQNTVIMDLVKYVF